MLKRLLVAVLVLSTQILADNTEKDYVILTDDKQIRLIFDQCTRMTPTLRTSYDELDNELVEKVEKMLPAALAKQTKNKSVKLDDYYRQYVSFDLLRRKLVYVNALHKNSLKQWAKGNAEREELVKNWQHKAITVCGQGGDKHNYWGALYDSQYNVVAEILFNSQPGKRK